ncbi:MAG: thiamine pyrophosphate-dependent enzyme [Candidatus Thermoplasmatota archaeon]|jgi:2-oxoglutarate ferredoxin oxidoreductase subunit beta|nr:thiamine pyrophosphate-dependent enzyme [Candidatus Thermoplasmatota archaeon]MCL5984132.1 thiamine pyrophosphate-dependent enzyme [Candidatus Thermoplasmatota archaeon]
MVEHVKPIQPTWCPGCGDFGVMAAVKKGLLELKIPSEDLVLVGGIGCSGGIHNFMDGYGFHALHGRLLPTAIGVKLANPRLTVLAIGGDGDGYAIGMGHFVHSLKKNASIVYVVMNNETYGLTKGQASPTSLVGFEGNVEPPIDAVLTALSVAGSGFIARGFSGSPKEATNLITQALRYTQERNGFAFVEILSPCVTYNDTYDLWRSKVQDVGKLPGYDKSDRGKAFATCLEVMQQGKIPIGEIYMPPPEKRFRSLDASLIPDPTKGPATLDISVSANAEKYAKMLANLE